MISYYGHIRRQIEKKQPDCVALSDQNQVQLTHIKISDNWLTINTVSLKLLIWIFYPLKVSTTMHTLNTLATKL